jgi:hypothetical protein
MSASRLRRWAAPIGVAALLAHVAAIGAIAWSEAGRRLDIVRRNRHEPFSVAQRRHLGTEYVDALRRIREQIAESETVYLVDEEATPAGAAYFALHYLAPRRVVLLGAPRRESPKLVQSRLPANARWVVVAPAVGAPLELIPADRMRPKGARRGS